MVTGTRDGWRCGLPGARWGLRRLPCRYSARAYPPKQAGAAGAAGASRGGSRVRRCLGFGRKRRAAFACADRGAAVYI